MANTATVGVLRVLLTANSAEFEAALGKASKSVGAWEKQLQGIGVSAANLQRTLAGAFTVGAIGKVVGDFVEMSGALVDLEAKTGISVTALQKLKLATEQSGVALGDVASAALVLQRNLAEGKSSFVGALEQVGLRYQDIRRLSPEDALFAVGDALGTITDQNDKVARSNELLGKAALSILPALTGQLRETADAYERLGLVIDEQVIRSGDDLGDQWTVLKSTGSALLAQVIGPLIPGLSALVSGFLAVTNAAAPVAKFFLTLIGYPFEALINRFKDTAEAIRLLFGEAQKLPDIKPPKLDVPKPGGLPTLDLEEQKRIEDELTESVKKSIEVHKQRAAQYDADAAAARAFYNFIGEREIENVQREQEAAERQQEIWRDYYNWLGLRRMEDDAAAEDSRRQQVFAASATFTTPIVDGFKAAVPEVRATAAPALATAFLGGMGDVFARQLGPTLMAAVTGGGKILESVGSLIGTSLTSGIAKMFKLAGPWGELVAGLGALVGPLLGKLFGGVSPEIKQARTDLQGFQQTLREGLTETQKQEAGTEGWKQDVIAVRDAYLATGRTAAEAEAIVQQMWNTDDPAKSKAAIAQINLVLKEQGQIIADNTQAAADAAAAREHELTDLRGRLATLKDESVIDFQEMQQAAQRYGVDVNSLGDKFQSERIHSSAQQIIDDFDLLTSNGASVGGVLFGMREEITALVKDSINFGTKIPANMQPWIEELARSGNLVDENGEKLTDISKLQFGTPVESKLDSVNHEIEDVTRKIEELTEKVGTDLVEAFERLPDHIDVDIRFNDPDVPRLGPLEVPGLAEGGIVTAPTLAMIGEGASPEAVIPLDHRTAGMGGLGSIVVLPFLPVTDPYQAAEEAAHQFRQRVGVDSHGMREVLEQVIDDWMRTYYPAVRTT